MELYIAELLLAAAIAGGAVFAFLRRRVAKSERALAEQRVNEERFRQLTSLSADWFWETDTEHRISWLSGGPAVSALFGAELAYGKRLWEIPGVEVEPRELVDHLLRLQQPDSQIPVFDFELQRAVPGGERRVHVVSGRPRHDAYGNFLGYRGVGRDMTEKRRAERALGHAKERLELATTGGNIAIWDIDLDTDRIYLSAGWARVMGEPDVSQTLRSLQLKDLVHPDDRERVDKAYAAAVNGTAPQYLAEYRVRTAAGDWKWVLSTGRVTQRDPGGRAQRLSGTVADIDARKRAEQATREAEERYRSLIELAPDGVLVSSGGVIEYANQAAARILKAGASRRLVGLKAESLVHPEHLERHRERMQYLQTGPGANAFEERRLVCLDGSEVVVEAASVSYLERGRLVTQSVLRDVSEQRKARLALAERERRFRDVVEASGEYVWETDAGWRYTYLSERAESVLGYLRHEVLGRTPRDFMPLGEGQAAMEALAQHAAKGEAFRDFVHRSLTKSGRVIWQSVSGVPVRDAAGKLAGYRGTGADITARKQAEERIQYLATRDALTGLPNRALLGDRANQAILSAARGRQRLAVLFLDLDRFKLVNDSLGHHAGDALLRAVAERLGGTLRRDDTLARTGGDEFVLLWTGLKSSQDAALAAQRVLGVLARPFTVEGHTLGITASVGISVYPEDGRDFAELQKNADAALHHAKETGRNTFRFSSPVLNARAVERLAMENDLRHALARGELLLHWQPVLRAEGNPRKAATAARVVGAEVLVRWQHPREGLLMPDRFVPVAEECGLIRALGEWTVERALSQIGAWQRAAPANKRLWFALNVSAHELAQGPQYVKLLAGALAANRLPGSCVELEVTERVLMSHLAENVATLRQIGELGMRVAIDDFGTGYSSLAYLRQLPIDKLKIDRSFLKELDASPDDAAIVKAIAAMAKSLGLQVAAEGVENETQLARLAALGCAEWQGHHGYGPLDAAEFERLLTERALAAG
jgi:diguanylate cyclase (GGDEF)-like protein/PAS domain S-box-containing protein